MRAALLVSAFLLFVILALTKLQNAHPGLDPRDQLTFEKQWAARGAEVRATKPPTLAALDCAAPLLSRASVRSLYVVWINNRPDMAPDRDGAAADLQNAITACHANPQAVEDDAHRHGQELELAAVTSLLKAGR